MVTAIPVDTAARSGPSEKRFEGMAAIPLPQGAITHHHRDGSGSSSSSSLGSLGSLGASRPTSRRLRVLVVRHGETDCNVQGIIQGQLDTDLNARGRQQAQQVAEALAAEQIDEVYSSPLRRARDTAIAIVNAHPNHAHGRLRFWFDDRLKERGFGSLEGKTFDRSKPKRDSIDGIEQTNVFCRRLSSFLEDAVVHSAPFDSQRERSADPHDPDWVDEPAQASSTYPAHGPGLTPNDEGVSGSPPRLNRAGCARTIAIVAHGAAISAMIGNVLLDAGIAGMAAGVQRTRVWNCSITELLIDGIDALPLTASHGTLDMEALAQRPGRKAIVVERWADVRHLPSEADEEARKTGAANGSADEMIGRTTA